MTTCYRGTWVIERVALAMVAVLSVGALGLIRPVSVRAQDAYQCIDDLTEDEIDYRNRFIEHSFARKKAHATAWRFGWMGGMAALGGLGLVMALDADDKWDRYTYGALAAGAGFAVLNFALVPMPDVWGSKRLKKKAEDTLEEKRAKLLYGTKLLDKSAAVQEFMGGPLTLGAGVGYGLVMGTVYVAKWRDDYGAQAERKDRVIDRLQAGMLFLVPPAMVGAQALTMPRNSIEDWEKYRGIACSSHYYESGKDDSLDLELSVGPGNIRFKMTF
ncbi:MAG: hypothetical protein R3A47_03325 [Polyangiales bacterium]